MFTAYVATKEGKITLCTMPSKRSKAEETAADLSKRADVERVSVAAYGRVIAAFKNGVQIDIESSQHGV
jgi:predicted site-specific integrase-resolvase